jgi:protease-4
VALAACKGRPGTGTSPVGSAGAPPAAGDGKLVEFDLTGSVPESMDAGGFFPLPATRTYTGLVRSLERAQKDAETTGYFVRLGENSGLNWAQVEELGRFFGQLRKQRKPVVCHAHGLSNRGLGFAAQACDQIWLSPGGSVDAVGIAAQVIYLKSALDKLKIHFDVLHMGRFKSAAEPVTRDGPSDEARQSLTETLASIRKTWLDGAEAARKRPALRQNFEQGPWGAEEAKAHGLVDTLGFEDQAREAAKKRAKAGSTSTLYGSDGQTKGGLGVVDILRIIAGGQPGAAGDHIAVLVAEGGISMESDGSLIEGGGITFKAFSKLINKLRDDESVKAVVLRIDSPGGSALASDLLWHSLAELQKKKPVITSVGSMAASGGYYLACATQRIVAERSSIVGSIGVVGGKVVVDAALAEIGVTSVTFPASPDPGAAARAGYLSPFEPWDDPTRERVRQQMRSIYELFLDRCAQGRKLPKEKLRESAEGRIWSGEQGKARGLIDEYGGLARALDLARQASGLGDDAAVRVEGARESLLEMLMLGDDASASEVERALERWQARSVLRLPATLQPLAASLAPLARGEKVVAALPFALTVR